MDMPHATAVSRASRRRGPAACFLALALAAWPAGCSRPASDEAAPHAAKAAEAARDGTLQVPLELPKVEVQGWPLQTLLLVGGAAAGIVLSLVSRLFVEVGARSKAAKARRILTDAIAAVTASEVVAPVHKELDRLASARDAVRQAL